MTTPETNRQTETPNRKPITRLTGGHASFIQALALMQPYSRGWILFYKHGLGFGNAYYRVAGADWIALASCCGPTGYDEIRLSILAALNGDGGVLPGIPDALELASLTAPRPNPYARPTPPTGVPSRDYNPGYLG